MIYSDLHIHSSYSDGILTPIQILNKSMQNNMKCISITDHDSISAQHELEKENCSIRIVPGIELSSEYNGHEIHLLGYFIDIHNCDLISVLNKIHKERLDRINLIIDKLRNLEIEISISDIEVDSYVSLGRPHIAKLLMKKGYVSSLREAFYLYLAKGKPAYIERFKINYKEALRLINDSGGLSALAHPGELYKGINLQNVLKDLKIYGLNGIEVFHPCHNNKDINTFYNVAKKYKLLITGGSDFHGGNTKSEINIGAIGLDLKLTTKLFNYYTKYTRGHNNELF